MTPEQMKSRVLSFRSSVSKLLDPINSSLEVDEWAIYDALQEVKKETEKLGDAIVKEIRKVPCERDLQISMMALNGWKYEDIATQYDLQKSAISKIVKKCFPHIARTMRSYTHNSVSKTFDEKYSKHKPL